MAQQIREQEDRRLLNFFMAQLTKPVARPTKEEIEARFEQIKDRIEPENVVKAQVIWCEDANQAAQVKASLDQDSSVEKVLEDLALNAQFARQTNLSASSQGMFWTPVWASEPNQILGPIRGFYRGNLQWRVIKVLEKTPGKEVTMHSRISDGIYSAIYGQRKDAILKPYQDKLLQKYDSKIYVSRLLAFDPLK